MEEIKHERKGSCAATPKRPNFNRAQQQQQLPSCYGGGTRRHTLQGPAGHADLRSVTAHHHLLTHPRPEPLSFPREKNATPVSKIPFLRCSLPKNQSPAALAALPVGFGEKHRRRRGRTDLAERRRSGARLHIPRQTPVGRGGKGSAHPAALRTRPAPHSPPPAACSPRSAPRPMRAAALPGPFKPPPPPQLCPHPPPPQHRPRAAPSHPRAAPRLWPAPPGGGGRGGGGGRVCGGRGERAFSCRRAAGSAAS